MQNNTTTCISEMAVKMTTLFIFNGVKLPNSCEEKILDVISDNELY